MAAIRRLDHITITTARVDETVAFYEEAPGFENRPEDRPNFLGVPGVWLFAGDQAVIHLFLADDDLGSPVGAFDHVAFATDDFDGIVARLTELGIEHSVTHQPASGLNQVFLRDPNGVQVEVTCPA